MTPAGRKPFLDILSAYLLKNKNIIDEHHWWANTTNPTELFNLQILCEKYPDFFKTIQPTVEPDIHDPLNTTYQFYNNYNQPKTIYIRFDDDICYMEKNALPNLLDFHTEYPDYFMVFPILINHISNNLFFDQKIPYLNKRGKAGLELHKKFLNQESLYQPFHHIQIDSGAAFFGHRMQCCCWKGENFQDINKDEIYDQYVRKPKTTRKSLAICGNSIMVHFGYKEQLPVLRPSGIYQEYYNLKPKTDFPLF